ncbi:hypothetical protein ACJEQI_26235, partial [Klebsiella variicola]|uniref:hypothetical protein n=1 Tax=Klebsiella variicola TaxID=244366 RepID=UPI0038710A1C
CVLPENPASYRVVRKKSYLFNKAAKSANFARQFSRNYALSNVTLYTICKKFNEVAKEKWFEPLEEETHVSEYE